MGYDSSTGTMEEATVFDNRRNSLVYQSFLRHRWRRENLKGGREATAIGTDRDLSSV